MLSSTKYHNIIAFRKHTLTHITYRVEHYIDNIDPHCGGIKSYVQNKHETLFFFFIVTVSLINAMFSRGISLYIIQSQYFSINYNITKYSALVIEGRNDESLKIVVGTCKIYEFCDHRSINYNIIVGWSGRFYPIIILKLDDPDTFIQRHSFTNETNKALAAICNRRYKRETKSQNTCFVRRKHTTQPVY